MKQLLVRRSAVGLALGALAATGLATVSASPAHAVVTDAEVDASGGHYDNASCTESAEAPSPADAPWSDNGVPVSNSYHSVGTATGVDPADVVDLKADSTATISSTPLGGAGPATITANGTASSSAVPRLPSTTCDGYAYSRAGADGEFVLTQPMWATFTVTSDLTGEGYGYIELYDNNGADVYVSGGSRTKGSVTAYLAPGEWNAYFYVTSSAHGTGTDPRASSYTMSAKVQLDPAGSAAAPSGKGAGYVELGARDCASGNVAAALTKKAKKKASQIVVKVNGVKAAKFKGKKIKKRAFVLAAARAADANVEATIKLKNGKKVTVTRTYRGC